MKNRIWIIVCLLLASCGGGGGGGTGNGASQNAGSPAPAAPVAAQPVVLAGALNTFESPTFLAVDAANNVYIADARNAAIYKASAGGTVSVVAGMAGVAGFVDGQGADARLHDPYGVAVDGAGNVYVVDLGNNAVRKVTPGGAVTTLAGSGRPGYTDGPGATATFNHPTGIATDSRGNLYVADQGNDAIRKIAPDGSVSTLATPTGLITGPRGIATDAQGNLYVVNENGLVTEFAADGTLITFYATPSGVSCIGIGVSKGGDLYLTCASGNFRAGKLYKLVAKDWQLVAGTDGSGYVNGPASGAQFGELIGVAVDASDNLYVADNGTASIRKITGAGAGVVSLLAGSTFAQGYADGMGASARFNVLTSITHDSANNLYVTDYSNNAVRKITSNGMVSTVRMGTNPPVVTSTLISPSNIVYNNNCLIVSAWNGNNLRGAGYTNFLSIDLSSNTNSTCPNFDIRETYVPVVYMALDPQNVLYYVDAGQVIESGNNGFFPIAGTSSLHPGGAPVFNQPNGMVLDSHGNIYLADSGDSVIYKIATDRTVSVFAGKRRVEGGTDGAGSNATFTEPYQLAIDGADNIYVVQKGPVRKITPSGAVTTLNLDWGTPALYAMTVTNGMLYGVTRGALVQASLP